MSDHLKLIRPSNFARSVLCAGWSRLAAVVPAPPPSDAAEEGTLLHARLPPETPLDDLTPEQQRQVEKARAFVAEKCRRIDVPGCTDYEQELPAVGKMLNCGTADVWSDEAEGAVIVDLKFGRLPLAETFAAYQGLIYGEAARMGDAKAEVWFYQPRAEAEDSVWHATVTAADKVTERVNAVLEAAAAPNAPRVPGREQCQYCPALAWCPEAAELTATFAVQVRDPQGLDPVQLGTLGATAKRVEGQAKAVLAAIREILLAGGAVPGFTLETRKGSRYVADPQAAYEALMDVVPLADFLALIEVPLGKLEEEFIDGLGYGAGETKKDLRSEFYRRLARVIVRKPDVKALTYHEKEDHGTGSSDG